VTVGPVRSSAVRAGWLVGGLVCVALGGIGIVVPGLPTTVFFIGAAACFSKSSPRLEAWVLDLKGIGPMVRDHRAGLGMPRRAKAVATAFMVLFVGLAVAFALEHPAARAVVAVAAVVGLAYIWWRVPTREAVLAERSVA
jgi:uncharacterized protein